MRKGQEQPKHLEHHVFLSFSGVSAEALDGNNTRRQVHIYTAHSVVQSLSPPDTPCHPLSFTLLSGLDFKLEILHTATAAWVQLLTFSSRKLSR